MIKLESVDFWIDQEKIIDAISLEVSEGSVLLVSGLPGSGKTTLLKLISGFYDQKEGDIDRPSRFFFLGGFSPFVGIRNAKVKDLVRLANYQFKISKEQINEKLSLIDLIDDLDARIGNLSNYKHFSVNLFFMLCAFESVDVVYIDLWKSIDSEKTARMIRRERIKFLSRGGIIVTTVSNNILIDRETKVVEITLQ